jgi:hypothetical protein
MAGPIVIPVAASIAGEIPKALFTVSPANAPTLGTANERTAVNEPSAITTNLNFAKNFASGHSILMVSLVRLPASSF